MSLPHGRPDLSLVICTLDEAEAIGPVLKEASAALAGLTYEIIVVDDSGDDRTADAVRDAGLANVRLIRRHGARGLASAALAGWDAARGETLAIMDGDGQHNPALITWLHDGLLDQGADLAVASRYLASGPSGLNPVRHLMSRLATLAARTALGVRASDPMSGFFVMRRDWWEAARPRLSAVGFKILADLMVSGSRSPKLIELSAILRKRKGGASKLDARVIIELLALILEKRSGGLIPSRFTLFASVGATGVAVHLCVLSAVRGVLDAPFWLAQAAAILVAMTWNFFLNNMLTFRDLRLKGGSLMQGLVAFYLSCLGGAVLNEAAAAGLEHAGAPWLAAGVAGAGLASVWNYWSSARAAWRVGKASVIEEAPAAGARPQPAAARPAA